MMLKDEFVKDLSMEAQAAINMFINCLCFHGIDAEDLHVCFDDDGVLHKWNEFQIPIPAEYADMDEKMRADFINKEVKSEIRFLFINIFFNLICKIFN